jgi:periplasmic protein TonB
MTGWEELIFENRNKKYGAYELRKKSTRYLVTGLVLSLLFIFISSISLFIYINSDLFFGDKMPTTISIEALQEADLQDFQFPEPPAPVKQKDIDDQSKPILIDSLNSEKKKLEEERKTASRTDTIAKKGAESNEDGKGANLNGDSIYIHVEKFPVFIGGNEAFTKFLIKNLSETAHRNKARLKVVVQFTIGKRGEVREISIISGPNPDVNKEVIRVFGMLPNWEPAEQNGHPVSFRFNLHLNL